MQKLNTLEQLVFVIIVCWLVGYGFAHLFKKPSQYEAWSKKQISALWNKHWKFFVGVLVGYVLTAY